MPRGRSSSRPLKSSRKRSRSYSNTSKSALAPTSVFSATGYSDWTVNSQSLKFAKMFNPFPNRHRAYLRYNDQYALVTTLGVPAHLQLRANSIYDVDYTNVGHQPYGHDTYQLIYNHYMVHKAVLTVTTTTAVNGRLCVQMADDYTVSSDQNTIVEQKNSVCQMQSNAGPPVPCRSVYQVGKTFPFANRDATGAQFGATPSEVAWWDVCMFDDSIGGSITVTINVQVEFYVEMWELRDLGAS